MKSTSDGTIASTLSAAAFGLVAIAVLAMAGLALAEPAGAAGHSPGLAPGQVAIDETTLTQGDVNCDDGVNPVDSLLLLRFAAGLSVNQQEPCEEIGTAFSTSDTFGDVDCAGAINPVDALKILRFAAGLSVAQNEPPPCTDVGQALGAAQDVDATIAGEVLQVTGSKDGDTVTLRLKAGDAGVLEVDVGDDGTADFSFDRALFSAIDLRAGNGDDFIRVDEANGAIDEPTTIFGENGNDTLLGGSAIETIDGGNGDDIVDGNKANDIAFMGSGNDVFQWDPGDGSDVVEGQNGDDILIFNGANGGETVDLSANGERFIFFRQPGNITMDVNEVETSLFNALGGPDIVTVNDLTGTDVTQVDLALDAGLGTGTGDGIQDQVVVNGTAGADSIVVTGNAGNVKVNRLSASVALVATDAAHDLLTINAAGGNDVIDASGLEAEAIKQLTIDGEGGDDVILGGRGADVLIGGSPVPGTDGNDLIDGNQANDIALMGAGDDVFTWDPGDGSDVVEGEAGADILLFNGAAADETVDLSANGERFTFFRQPGNITMDTNEVETSLFNGLGGADTLTVNDLAGTDVTQVNILGNPVGGDGKVDRVVVNGTPGNDDIVVTSDGVLVNVTGLAASVAIGLAEPTDVLAVNALAGIDTVDASGLAADAIKLEIDGGADADVLTGGAGDDLVDGGPGNDTAFMGAGNDTFRWDPGDGSDVVEGQDGDDTLLFNGAAADETVTLSANDERFTFFRQPGNITMDVNDVETSVFNALGGADVLTVNDLSGADVTDVEVNLENLPGSGMGDGAADQVIVNGTDGDDAIVVTGNAGGVNVTGLSAAVAITHVEAANDRLDVNTLAGTDSVNTVGLVLIQVFVDGLPV